MPIMIARRPMKRKRLVGRRRTPGYRNGVVNRTSQSANFRTGSRAMKPTAGLSSSVSSVFTATTSGVIAQPGAFQLVIRQENNGSTLWELPTIAAEACLAISTTLNAVGFTIGGTLRQLTFNGASTFQGLYDFYRIDRVEIVMYIGNNWISNVDPTVGGAADYNSPVVVYAVDSNDSVPISQANLLSYANVQMKQCAVNSPIQMSYKPAGEAQLGNVTTISGTGPVFSPKIGTATPNVVHYGVKMCPMGLTCTPPNGTSLAGVAFVIKQYVTFFDRRSV